MNKAFLSFMSWLAKPNVRNSLIVILYIEIALLTYLYYPAAIKFTNTVQKDVHSFFSQSMKRILPRVDADQQVTPTSSTKKPQSCSSIAEDNLQACQYTCYSNYTIETQDCLSLQCTSTDCNQTAYQACKDYANSEHNTCLNQCNQQEKSQKAACSQR